MKLRFLCLLQNPTLSFVELLGLALWACAVSANFSVEIALSQSFSFKYIKLQVCVYFLWVYSENFEILTL